VHARSSGGDGPAAASTIVDVSDGVGGGGGGGVTVLSGCCRFPLQSLACAAGATGGVHGQHSPQMPHTAVPLGPEMAKGAFERRLPLSDLLNALHSVPLKELISHCLSSPQHALMHLSGLSMLGGATAGARELLEDPLALNFAHFEYFGRPFAVAASLHEEHQPLIDDLLDPKYTQRYGERFGRLVQKSFLRDVAQPDLACVVCSALRAPNVWVVGWLNRLHRSSQFEDVRDMAGAIHSHYCSVCRSGKINSNGEAVASEEHAQILLDELTS
jgi:hypothetical protein